MWRIRIIRAFVFVAIVGFVVLIAMQWQTPPSPRPSATGPRQAKTTGTGLDMISYDGDRPKLSASIDSVRIETDDTTQLKGIKNFTVNRVGRPPLIVDAAEARAQGEIGARAIDFLSGVKVHDPEADLTLLLPNLSVDETEGTATTPDSLTLEGPTMNGGATGLVYGLDDQPTQLKGLNLVDSFDGVLKAELALLHDGLDDIELLGSVHLARGADQVFGERIRIRRDDGEMLDVVADGDVHGSLAGADEPGNELLFRSEALELNWDGQPEVMRAWLQGAIELTYAPGRLRSESLNLRRQADGSHDIAARGAVEIQGPFADEANGKIKADTVEARLNPLRELESAVAFGSVEFEGERTRGEAQRAVYRHGTGALTLFGTLRRKARLARDAMRVAAVSIETEERGSQLTATQNVEATLLPTQSGEASDTSGMFATDAAIHFVSERLSHDTLAGRLEFSSNVRAWQGSRNLAADRILLGQKERTLRAVGNVHSRFPRSESGEAISDADFIQISSAEFDYSDAAGLATYRSDVRARMAEGKIDSAVLQVFRGEDSNIREILAAGDVRLEFPQKAGGGLIEGSGDRLLYQPKDGIVWLIGESKPAQLMKKGGTGQQGATAGRILRYHLESGTIEVESGDGLPGRIGASQ